MTNKLQLMTALTLATILIAGGLSLTPEAFSTGNNDNGDKDKKGGQDSEKFKKWKNEHESHDDDDEEHDKIKVCHIPPGEPANKHTIEISESALAAHLGHGDTIGACPDDNDDELAHIIFIRAITDDNNWPFSMNQFKLSIANGPIPTVGQPVEFGVPIPIEPNTDKYITGEMPAGYKSVLITGDPLCPVNINDDKFSLKKGKTIICTIYYDDVFQPGGSEGNDPTVKVTVQVNGLPDVNPPFTYTIGSTAGVTDGDTVTIPKNVPVEFSQTNHLDELDGKILPTSIQGDGNCPDVIGTGGTENGFITLSANQNIECIVVYGEEFKPGVIFHYDTQRFGKAGSQNLDVGIPCGDIVTIVIDDDTTTSRYVNTATEGPCIAVDGPDVWVVPDPSVTLTDTTIVLFTVIITGSDEVTQNDPAKTTCVFNGLAPTFDQSEPPAEDRPLAFKLTCAELVNNGNWNVNYALIEANPLA